MSLFDSIPHPKQLFKTRGDQSDIKWSPDDSKIAFVSRRGDHSYFGVYDHTKETLAFMDLPLGKRRMDAFLYAQHIPSGKSTQLTHGDGIIEDYHLTADESSILLTTNIGDQHRRHIGQIDF